MKRHCLIVEDEDTLGHMLVDNLVSDTMTAERVADGRAALRRLAGGGVDIVVLDLMLPEVDGFGVLEAMRTRGDHTPVLVLSALSSDHDRIRALEGLADDYLTKPFNLRELLLRVHALLRRRPTYREDGHLLAIGGSQIDLAAHRILTWNGRREDLSITEVKLLRLLADHAGEVVTREAIVSVLFGPHTPVKVRTVDNLVLRLRKLLEQDPRHPSFLHTARGVGLRLVTGDQA